MNILYINHYAGSPEMGMEFRPYYLAREWVKMGHHVTIMAGDYSHLRKNNPAVEKDFQSQTIDGIEYVWLKTGAYTGNGVSRALTMARFVRKLLINTARIAKYWKPDVVIASSTYPLDTYPAQSIAKKTGSKYFHEVHDMWPATLYEIGGMSKKHPFVVLMQIAENSAYKHCDKCVSLLPYAKDYMVEHGLRTDKFVNIQNGVVEEEWTDFERIPALHERLFQSLSGKTVVGYFGGHALSNALDTALDVAKEYQRVDSSVAFVFVGDGMEKERLIERSKEEKMENVYFLPPVVKRAVPDLLRHFDCSFMTAKSSPLYRFGLCFNKMYDSMMAGIPVVCAINAPETLVTKYKCGYQCDPTKTEEVVEAIHAISTMTREDRVRMGSNGKKAVLEHFTYEKLAKEFSDLF